MKLPRNVSGARLQALLRRLGHEAVSQRGSRVRITPQNNGEQHEAIHHHNPIGVLATEKPCSRSAFRIPRQTSPQPIGGACLLSRVRGEQRLSGKP